MTQKQAAAARGVCYDIYRWQELGLRPVPAVPVGGFRRREICLIKRRRMGWSQKELAEVLGCTKLWVLRMENGTASCSRLYSYWMD